MVEDVWIGHGSMGEDADVDIEQLADAIDLSVSKVGYAEKIFNKMLETKKGETFAIIETEGAKIFTLTEVTKHPITGRDYDDFSIVNKRE